MALSFVLLLAWIALASDLRCNATLTVSKRPMKKQANIDPSAVQAALEKLKKHPEPEAGYICWCVRPPCRLTTSRLPSIQNTH